MMPERTLREWFSTLPVALLLLSAIVIGTGEMAYSQFLKLGEYLWNDYYTLRSDVPTPTCDPYMDVDAEVRRLQKEQENDEFGDLFGDAPQDNSAAMRESVEAQKKLCQENHAKALDNQNRVTTSVKMFRHIDYALLALSDFGRTNQRMVLAILLFICAITTTLTHHHIGLRSMRTRLDHQLGGLAIVVSFSILTYSSYTYLVNGYESAIPMLHPQLRWTYLIGCIALTLAGLYMLFKIPKDAPKSINIGQSLLAVPLFCYMAFIAANYYIFKEGNVQGIILHINILMDHADMFVKIGLYIWIGMMLKQTFIGELVFRIFKPWRLPPEVMAFVAVVLMAVPTAYTGASGVIIMALGAVVYLELRRAGARRQLALAATAMSGSLGVVLRPCLLVVLIAALNKEVTTNQLFYWGVNVFILTSFLFFVISLAGKEGPFKIAPASEALKPSLGAFKPLIPYVLVFVGMAILYRLILDAKLDEFSAPVMLPVLILALVIYEKIWGQPAEQADDYHDDERQTTSEASIRFATTESTIHIGALLMLMALGAALGGVFEGNHAVLALLGDGGDDTSIWQTLTVLNVVLILIGMTMDAFAAVIVVTFAVAQTVYAAGVDPLHFWMIVLVAFELSYLTPPVAVNHLFTRQVVGQEEIDLAVEETRGKSFWRRHERYLLPLAVMLTALLVVSYGPAIYQSMF